MQFTQSIRCALAAVSISLLSGCMSYSNYPDTPPTASPAKRAGTLNYKIDGSAMFAGPTAIREVIATDAPFQSVAPAEKELQTGNYLSVKIEQNSPSLVATVFGYISYATLTIIPFWSTQDGSTLTFTEYKDGANVKSKEYVIKRGTFVWLPMILVAWVNVFTPSEEDAFKASTRDFLATL